MTFEQTILEILKLIGVGGAVAVALAGSMFIQSRANMAKASAASVEAKAQASIAKDNADVVRSMAQKSDDDRSVLMKYVLDGQAQIVALTQQIGDVQLDLTERINAVTVTNARLETEIIVRRESERFIRDEVLSEIRDLKLSIEGVINDQSNGADSSISADERTESSSLRENSKPEVDHNQRTDKDNTEISFSGGGSFKG